MNEAGNKPLRECFTTVRYLDPYYVRQLSQSERKTLVVALRAFRTGAKFAKFKNEHAFKDLQTTLGRLKCESQSALLPPRTEKPRCHVRVWRVFTRFLKYIGSKLEVRVSTSAVMQEKQKAVDIIALQSRPTKNYFEAHIREFQADVNFLKRELARPDSPEKNVAISKHIQDNTIQRLAKLSWVFDNLDPEREQEVLVLARLALNEFSGQLETLGSQVDEETNVDIRLLQSVLEDLLTKGGEVAPSPCRSAPPALEVSTLYNPSPEQPPLDFPYEILEHNADERTADILSMLKGERMELAPRDLGTRVFAPSVFAVDLPRLDEFNINGFSYYKNARMQTDEKHARFDEVGRELYRILGKEGATRVMQVCHQGILGDMLTRVIPALTDPDTPGPWASSYPIKDLVAKNESDSGFVFNVQVDSELNTVAISMKMLMCLGGPDRHDSLTNNPQFVVRTDITMPLHELTRKDLDDEENPVPNLEVVERVSKLVINNPEFAQRLFLAF